MKRDEIFSVLQQKIEVLQSQKVKPLRVAVNGIEGTGKTTFAEGLVAFLRMQNIKAIHVSIDGFHFHKERRYRQGRDSAKGYYEDAYDEDGFVQKVLLASQAEKPHYTRAIHDLASDEYMDIPATDIPHDAVLITDGAYLFKPTYRDHWDLKIYLKTDFETAMQRGVERDKDHLGGHDAAIQKFNDRYHRASRIYIEENNPEALADMVIDNTDFENVRIVSAP